MSIIRKLMLIVLSICFLFGMAAKAKDVDNLKIELIYKIDSVNDYLISKDGGVLLYSLKVADSNKASKVSMLNITEDPKTKVLSFDKTESSIDIDPGVLSPSSSWTQLFEDKIIYRDRRSINVITKKLDGTILSEIPCHGEVWEPVISATGKYVAVIPSIDAQYPSLLVYETRSGKKLWEKFTPPDIYYGGGWPPPFLVEATFIGNDSLVVYYEGKIRLFDVKSGRIYWEGGIFRPLEEYSWSLISVAENGDIIFFGSDLSGPSQPDRLYYFTSTGKKQWIKVDVGSTKISPKGKYVMVLDRYLIDFTDVKSGKSLWRKKTGGEGGMVEVFYGLDDEYIVIEGQSNEYLTFFLNEYRDYNIFVLKSSSGEVVGKFKGYQLSFSSEYNILFFKNGDTLFFYQLTLEK